MNTSVGGTSEAAAGYEAGANELGVNPSAAGRAVDPEIRAGVWAVGVAGLETYSAIEEELEASSEVENGFIADVGFPLGSPGTEISPAAVAEGEMGSGIGTVDFIGGDKGSKGVRTEPDEDTGSEEISEEEAGFTEGSTVLSSLDLDTAVPGEVEPEIGAEVGLPDCEESGTGLEGPIGIPEGATDPEAGFIIGPALVIASAECSEGEGSFTGDLAGATCLEASTALSTEAVTESGTGAKIGVCSWEETDSGPDTGHTSGAAGPDANFTAGT
ncbi:hypothetical protein E2320_016174 [Naja naja]|nr:hypothetical protein E2320_016174 [Naja naja]